jgi:hypothetical protein
MTTQSTPSDQRIPRQIYERFNPNDNGYVIVDNSDGRMWIFKDWFESRFVTCRGCRVTEKEKTAYLQAARVETATFDVSGYKGHEGQCALDLGLLVLQKHDYGISRSGPHFVFGNALQASDFLSRNNILNPSEDPRILASQFEGKYLGVLLNSESLSFSTYVIGIALGCNGRPLPISKEKALEHVM